MKFALSLALFTIFSLVANPSRAQWQDFFAKSQEEYKQNEPPYEIREGRKALLVRKLEEAIKSRNVPLLREIFVLAKANFIDIIKVTIPMYGGGFGGEFTPMELVSIYDDQNEQVYEFFRENGGGGLPFFEARRAREEHRREEAERIYRDNEQAAQTRAVQEQAQFPLRTAVCSIVVLMVVGMYFSY